MIITVSLIVLVLFVILVGKSDFGAFRNTVYIGVPYLLSTYISLKVISKFRSKETIYVCTAVSVAVSLLMMIVNSNYHFIYSVDFIALWAIAFAMLTILSFFSFIRFVKSQEELQWGLL